MMLLFGSIASVGIQNLVHNKVNLDETRNIIIVSVTLTLGIGGAIIPMGSFSLSGIGLAAIAGVILNLVIPHSREA
jgi:uracil permease